MQIEFDSDKDEVNRFKHGISLAFGARVFDDPLMALLPTVRLRDGEERYKAVGLVDGRLYTAVHVERDDTIRMISVRRSNDGERRDYYSDAGGPE